MQLSIMITMMIMTATIMPFTNNILSLGAMLLMMALTATMMVSMTITSWFAFILFLIYITGLLVLFSYMMAMSPNSYQVNKNKSKMTLMIMTTMTMMSMMTSPTMILESPKGKKTFEEEVVKLFEPTNVPMYWLIATTLLIALLMAVTVCFKTAKPLRSFNP